MRTNLIKLIPMVFALFLTIPACQKKDDGPALFTHRIISLKMYSNDQLENQGTVEYSGNKISKISLTDYYNDTIRGTYVYLFTYPDADKISATFSQTEGNQTITYTLDVALTNNKVTERIEASVISKSKTTFSYNPDGKVEKIKIYRYDSSWILSSENTYTYSAGKLVQISDIVYGGTINYESKDVFSYNGEELKEEIHSYKQSEGTWTESGKNVYTYSAGKISKISMYYKNGTEWTVSGYEDFSYDSDGNLITESYNYNNNIDKTEYTYQDGSGNFLQIIDALGGNNNPMYPTPNKKSRKMEMKINNFFKFTGDIFHKRLFEFLI